jgi:ATP-dependent RNA helicase RhlE
LQARGIDVDGISHVVNFDLPNVPETYVHRIGRTARAGAAGVAISLCDCEEAVYLRDIEKLIRMSIPVTDHRTSRQAQPSTIQSRTARPSAHAAAKRRQRGRGSAPRKQDRQEQSAVRSQACQPRRSPPLPDRPRRRSSRWRAG